MLEYVPIVCTWTIIACGIATVLAGTVLVVGGIVQLAMDV